MIKAEYIEVLKDSFLANFLFTFNNELVLPLIFYYKNYNNFVAIIIAYFASIAGLMATYYLCLFTTKLLKKYTDNPNSRVCSHYFNKTSPIFFAVSAFPQINVIVPFFAGFLRITPLKTFVLIAIYRAIYYAYFFYYPDNF